MTVEPSPEIDDRRGAARAVLRKVLVTDDSAAIRRILTRTLAAAGYEVFEAGDGHEALAVCRTEHPDLVLLDVDMPVMDGINTLRAMKDDAELSRMPVLFLTARTAGADVASGPELRAQDYLRKPCEPTELLARVSAALRIKANEEALERQAQELDQLSSTDTLTGLGNRRRLEAHIAELAPTTHVNALLLDIDRFKQVNDTEGHAVGDLVLRIAAFRVQKEVDGRHLVVRWGGEEFVVLSTGIDGVEAGELAEALRVAVAATPFGISPQLTLSVTVSIGCASGPARAFDLVLRAADNALYQAKRQGRNRVVAAEL